MDCVRGVEFIAERPEVDPDRIGVLGGSQACLESRCCSIERPTCHCDADGSLPMLLS